MIFTKLVLNVTLVFTTLAILNSIGIVSSQDELEHGLATDCKYKGLKTGHSFKSFPNLLTKFVAF